MIAFEAAARHLNFTLAAGELNVTQGAVSRQIAGLEGFVGHPLFQRKCRALALTPAGKQLYESLTVALGDLSRSVGEVRQKPRQAVVKIGANTACASLWLMPRIPSFCEAFPQLDLHLVATDQGQHLAQDECDVAIMCGKPDGRNVTSLFLFGEEIFPVCSPAYLQRHPHLHAVDGLASSALLHWEDASRYWGTWPGWFGAKGLKIGQPRRGLIFNNYSHLIQAAVNGQGVALGWRYIVDDLLERGELVRPVDTSLQADGGYYLVTPERTKLSPEIGLCVNWIVEQAQSCSRRMSRGSIRGTQ